MGSGILKLGPATMPPACCFICAGTPVDEDDESHPLLPFVYPEGMDINWGETPYMCWTCVGLMADLIGRPDAEKIKAAVRGARLMKKHNERLVSQNDELKASLKAVLEGSEASEKAKELISDV